MDKEQWINAAYDLLCTSQGAPENETERNNLREWAQSFADEYFPEGMTPQEAPDEEISCG